MSLAANLTCRKIGRWTAWLAAGMVALLAQVSPALACSVCYGGDSDSSIIAGAELSVLFLGGLVYLLIGGGGLAFFLYRRSIQRAAGSGADDEITGLEADHTTV